MRKTGGCVRVNEDLVGMLVALVRVASVEYASRAVAALDM